MSSDFKKGLTNGQHMHISKERNKLKDRHLHVNVNCWTFHPVMFLDSRLWWRLQAMFMKKCHSTQYTYVISPQYCVVSENIHTPTTEGISLKSPPPPRNFHFLDTKITPPPLRNFLKLYVHPPYPLDKIVLASKCVKVKVNTPHAYWRFYMPLLFTRDRS